MVGESWRYLCRRHETLLKRDACHVALLFLPAWSSKQDAPRPARMTFKIFLFLPLSGSGAAYLGASWRPDNQPHIDGERHQERKAEERPDREQHCPATGSRHISAQVTMNMWVIPGGDMADAGSQWCTLEENRSARAVPPRRNDRQAAAPGSRLGTSHELSRSIDEAVSLGEPRNWQRRFPKQALHLSEQISQFVPM